MTDLDLAYFAGVFDAAGVLDLKDDHGNPKPRLELRSTDQTLLRELSAAFGGNITMACKRDMLYRWKRDGRPAQHIIRQLQPFLRRKRMEAQRVMGWQPMRPGIKVPKVKPWTGIAGMDLTKAGRGFGRRA
ncbi:MAG: hypothetical protein ACM3SS_02665 [Rhodospirillaceae bacterium]